MARSIQQTPNGAWMGLGRGLALEHAYYRIRDDSQTFDPNDWMGDNINDHDELSTPGRTTTKC
jgi:hypothetical protein